MSQLARLGFILLGLRLILEPLSIAGGSLAEVKRGDFSIDGLAFSLGWWVAFGLLPGCVLCLRSRSFAEVLFPLKEGETVLDSRALVTAGVAVLGAYFVVTGLSVASGSAIMLVITRTEFPQLTSTGVGSIITGFLELAFGLLLMLKSRPLTAFLFSRSGPGGAAA